MPLNQPSGEMTASATGGPEAAVSRDVSEARSASALETAAIVGAGTRFATASRHASDSVAAMAQMPGLFSNAG